MHIYVLYLKLWRMSEYHRLYLWNTMSAISVVFRWIKTWLTHWFETNLGWNSSNAIKQHLLTFIFIHFVKNFTIFFRIPNINFFIVFSLTTLFGEKEPIPVRIFFLLSYFVTFISFEYKLTWKRGKMLKDLRHLSDFMLLTWCQSQNAIVINHSNLVFFLFYLFSFNFLRIISSWLIFTVWVLFLVQWNSFSRDRRLLLLKQ